MHTAMATCAFHAALRCHYFQVGVARSSNLPWSSFAALPQCFPISSPPISTTQAAAANAGRSDGAGAFPGDEFGLYPWDPSFYDTHNNDIEWVQDDIVTLFTTDGLIQIGGSRVPRQIFPAEKRQSRGKSPIRYRRYREEDYMDPKQGLCLGAIFDIAATNGLDTGRRFCVFGFCRSIEMLSDAVEDTVLEQGGEVVVAEKASAGGLNEKLSMTVAVPLLWGVPPAVETLNYAIRSGGGIVEKVSWQWEFL